MTRGLASIFFGIVLISTTGCTKWAEKKPADWNSATSAEQLNRLLWQDISGQKWESLSKRIAPLAVMNEGANAFSGRDTILQHLKSKPPAPVQIGEMQSQPAGENLVSTYTVTIGTDIPQRVMTVWQSSGQGWVVVAHTVTSGTTN